MKPRRHPPFWLGALWCASILAGCDYGASSVPVPVEGQTGNPVSGTISTEVPGTGSAPSAQDQDVMLKSALQLIETAATTPGGDNFKIAVDRLNGYFKATGSDADFAMEPTARKYLAQFLPEDQIRGIESRTFVKRDGRHIEDCLLYHAIATRVAGTGDELSRVRAVFDWLVRHVQLVPPQSLGLPNLPQAPARPFDVLLRGMATEQGGEWAERAWVFMALCRQLQVDVGLVRYKPPAAKQNQAAVWVCAAVIGDKAYLFDTRIGEPIPGPDGSGVATLEEAATIPNVLDRLDLPGESPYQTTQADLAAGKLTILIDSTLGYFSPRMREFQERLSGKNRMILYRDPIAQRTAFSKALGARFADAEPWRLPLEVEYRLFNDPTFVSATQLALAFFDNRWPLLSARLDQLRGQTETAMTKYVKFRFIPDALQSDDKTPIPGEIKKGIDMYATYFLALCQLDLHHHDLAAFQFNQTLELMPGPRPNTPYYYMFRWGAQDNLARLCERKGDLGRAIAYYCELEPTSQHHGNLLHARNLVWQDPMASLPAPLPAAPPVLLLPGQSSASTGAAR